MICFVKIEIEKECKGGKDNEQGHNSYQPGGKVLPIFLGARCKPG